MSGDPPMAAAGLLPPWRCAISAEPLSHRERWYATACSLAAVARSLASARRSPLSRCSRSRWRRTALSFA